MTIEASAAACRELLEAPYRCFLRDLEIDLETGTTPRQAARKFATYPYIGSRYGSPGPRKLLIVGLDIGSDETPGRLQHFEERRQAIELRPLPAHNAHIAGTYFTALRYACTGEEWARIRDCDQTCETILKGGYALSSNPLSCIALTNFHKWVTKGRRNRGGRRIARTLIATAKRTCSWKRYGCSRRTSSSFRASWNSSSPGSGKSAAPSTSLAPNGMSWCILRGVVADGRRSSRRRA